MTWDEPGGVGGRATRSYRVIGKSGNPKIPNHKGHEGTRREPANPTADRGQIAETHANLGSVGITSVKAFGILIGAQGGGVRIAEIARHRRHRVNPKSLTTKDDRVIEKAMNPGAGLPAASFWLAPWFALLS